MHIPPISSYGVHFSGDPHSPVDAFKNSLIDLDNFVPEVTDFLERQKGDPASSTFKQYQAQIKSDCEQLTRFWPAVDSYYKNQFGVESSKYQDLCSYHDNILDYAKYCYSYTPDMQQTSTLIENLNMLNMETGNMRNLIGAF